MADSAVHISELVKNTLQSVWDSNWESLVEPIDRISPYERAAPNSPEWGKPYRGRVLIMTDDGRGKVFAWSEVFNCWHRFA